MWGSELVMLLYIMFLVICMNVEKINIYMCVLFIIVNFPLTFCHQVSDLVVYELYTDTHPCTHSIR